MFISDGYALLRLFVVETFNTALIKDILDTLFLLSRNWSRLLREFCLRSERSIQTSKFI